MLWISLVWGAVVALAVLASFKWYLPRLISSIEKTNEEFSTVFATKKWFQIVALIISVVVAVLCGLQSGYRHDDWLSVFKMLLALSVLNIISITDVTTYRIPNLFVVTMLVGRALAVVPELLFGSDAVLTGLLGSVIAGAVSLLFLLLMSQITRGGLGYGDVKLFGALGFLCGVNAVLYTLFFSFFLCAVVSLFLLLTRKKKIKDGVPLGPFVWLGFALTVALGLC